MQIEKIKDAIQESQRFINKAKAVLKLQPQAKIGTIDYTKETAACRRASMDLTRVLAELRKSRSWLHTE